MKKKNLKEIINKKKLSFGSWITIPDVLVPEIFSSCKFDWLCVDLEHSNIDLSQLMNLIISIEKNNMSPLVRVGEINENLIKRVMDMGAHGIIAPNVCNREQAQKVVDAVKYPPQGKRGFGLFKAQGFGSNFNNYIKWVKKQSIVIVQIEHVDAVENLEEIFSVEGVDGFLVGPYDLSGSMGIPGKLDDKKLLEKIKIIFKEGKKFNKCAGIHVADPTKKKINNLIKVGFKFIGVGMDSIFLKTGAENVMKELKQNKAYKK